MREMYRGWIRTLAISLSACALLALPAIALAVPSIDESIQVPGWWVIGPFPSGIREAGTDALAYYDDAQPLDTPQLQSEFPSAVVPGGYAHWRYYQADESGKVTIDYPEVPDAAMDLIVDEWGYAGASTKGYAFATIEIDDGPRRALVDLQNAGSFSLNGIPYPADAYGHHMGPTPVVLTDGRNEFKVTISRGQQFTFRLDPVADDLIVLAKSATLPDIVHGQQLPALAAVPLINATDEWLRVTGIELNASDVYAGEIPVTANIAPLSLYNLPLLLPASPEAKIETIEEDNYSLPITVSYDGGSTDAELNFRVRTQDQSRRITFSSQMDGSVQYYGLLPPSNYDPAREYGLILTLHGAGVEAQGQVDAYKPKDWAFVVAPTNRRRFGFDWQDWGRLDMLEVLSDVKSSFPIDENRIHLTGHSMGGHGTWYNALLKPDLWATAAPSAGWTTFDLYVPMFLRRNAIVGNPRANLIWQLALREDNTLVLTANALNLPIYALEGGADDNVPPQQPRMLVEELVRRGYDVTYREVPGMGHWWNDPDTSPTDCVDSDYFNAFWREHVRDPWPKHVVFQTHNYSLNNQSYWVRVDAPEQAYRDVMVDAEVTDTGKVVVNTTNVRALSLKLAPKLIAQHFAVLNIDGQELDAFVGDEAWLSFSSEDGGWQPASQSSPQTGLHKRPALYGPWRQAMMRPFVLVYGTMGTPEQTQWTLQLARLYAYHWWYRGNGHVEIIADKTAAQPAYQGMNMILLGGPDCNAVTARISSDLPIRVLDGGLAVGGRRIAGSDLTYKLVYPNPLTGYSSLVLVEGGTSLEAMKRLPAFMAVYSGGGFPDWMVWGDDVKLKGLAGAYALGFFDMDWQIDDGLTYWNDELLGDLP